MHIREPFRLPNRPTWYIEINRKRVSTGTDEYDKAMEAYRKAIAYGSLNPLPSQTGMYKFVTDFLNWSQATQSIYTYKSYRTAMDKLQNHCGNIPICDLGTQQIDSLIASQLATGISRTSVNTMLRHIKGAIGKAAEWYNIPRFKIKLLRIEKKPPQVLNLEQAQAVLEQLDGNIKLLLKAFLVTGRRRQELLKLTWNDIDMDGRRYYVHQRKVHLSGWFPISRSFGDVLQSLPRGDGPVFGNLHPDTVTHQIKKALVRCGHGHLRLHDLRHSFATMYLENGGDVAALKELLGHQQISTTMIYSHLSMQHLGREADRVGV